jgi:hypothetical protein
MFDVPLLKSVDGRIGVPLACRQCGAANTGDTPVAPINEEGETPLARINAAANLN